MVGSKQGDNIIRFEFGKCHCGGCEENKLDGDQCGSRETSWKAIALGQVTDYWDLDHSGNIRDGGNHVASREAL